MNALPPVHGGFVNLEGGLGLALILLIVVRSIPVAAAATGPADRIDFRDVLVWLLISTGIAVAFWRILHLGFLSDDFVMIAHAPDFHARSSFTTGGGDGFFRPLIYAIFAGTERWAGADPLRWHASGIATHAVNTLLVYLVAWALGLSRFARACAASVFAIHATRPEVVVWITGRFDLYMTMFVLTALFFFIRSWDVPPQRALAYRAIAMAAMIAGLLSKEAAYAFPVMLLALAVCKPEWRRKPVAFVPFFAVAVALFAYRWSLLGSIGGYRDSTGKPQILSLGLLTLAKGLALRMWAVLFFPINWTVALGVGLAIAGLLYLGAWIAISVTRPKRPPVLLSLALLIASVSPVAHLLLIGSDLEKSRYLYLPSAMFAILLAILVEGSPYKWWVAVAILVFQRAALEHNLGAWEFAASKAESACATVAAAGEAQIAVVGLPDRLNGVYFFANGFPECVAMRGSHAQLSATREPGIWSTFVWDPKTLTLLPLPRPSSPPSPPR
jgi:hypothetical protein